jgi:hypothetical protein
MMGKGIILLAALTFATPVFAQTATPDLDRRIARQEARIEQGVRNGSLTRSEAARLRRDEARLKQQRARAKADGVVTRKERAALQREADRMDRRIAVEKHDTQVR